jgi:molybdate transport system substrate-binding protein
MVALAGCSNTNSQNNVVEPAEKAFVGKTLNLFVAAGLQKPVEQIIESFKEETGAEVSANYASSGSLYAQIDQGQPCDLYYSADWMYIDKLDQSGKLEEGQKFLKDNIVLIASETGQNKISKIGDLANPGVSLVIADPQAPAGVYAKNSLVNLGLWDKVSSNIKAMPSTVNQVLIMVKEDQVDAGLVYSSVANGNGLQPVEVIDEKYSGEIIFGSAIINGKQTDLSQAFIEHASKNINFFEQYGWKAYE